MDGAKEKQTMDELIIRKSTHVGRGGGGTDHPRALRAYPSSPCSMHLQVRGIQGQKTMVYAGAELTEAEARQLRDYLTAVLTEHFGSDR